MKKLIEAYQRVLRKKNIFFKWLIVFLVFSWNVWTFESSSISFPLGLILSIFIGGVLLWYLHTRIEKAENFLLHRLIEPRDVNRFLNTIDHELQSIGAISIRDDISGMYLFITETWIILLSTGASFVRRVENVVSVETVFHTSKSKSSIHFDFSNGESFGCFCNEHYEEICALFSKEERRTQS